MDDLLLVFGTKIKAMEALALLNNIKPVIRHGYYKNELEKVKEFCKKNELFFVLSEFKVLISDKNKEYYEKGIMVKKDDKRQGIYFAYISKDEYLANLAALYEIKNDNCNLGKILGYPKCCCEFFDENFKERSKLDNKFDLPLIKNSGNGNFSFLNNIFLRHKDICLLSHYPCNLNCEKSKETAKKNLEILKSHYPKTAFYLQDNLKGKFEIFDTKIVFL